MTGPGVPYTWEQARANLHGVYARLPQVHCKGLCADACTNVAAAPLERALVAAAGVELPPALSHRRHLELIAAGQHQRCPALGPLNTCTVHAERPLLCRSFGTLRLNACEHGCWSRFIEYEQLATLMQAVRDVSDRWERAGRPGPAPADLPSITCPRCGLTSWHPTDVAEGYCGGCHEYTGPPTRQATSSGAPAP